MAWAAMATVPRVDTVDWIASFPNWNMLFSIPDGIPMSRIFLITRTLKQTDILRFPWDEEEKKDTSVTDEEMQRLRAKAKEVESQLNTNKDV